MSESKKNVRRKLDAILSPETDVEELELSDIIDGEKIQELMDEFYRLTNVGIGVIDLHGNVLVGTGWQDICTKFHRANPESRRLCIESDLELSRNVPVGTFKLYRCRHNMWDMATPIMLGDRHVGNIFLGQFLFDDEMPDYEAFRRQAHRYGFNEEEYLAALDRVPRWSRGKVDAAMSFYAALAGIIGNLSYSNIKLANALEDRKKAEQALREREEFLSSIVENIPDMIFIKDAKELKFVRFNRAGERLLGFSRDDLIGKSDYDFFPEEQADFFTKKDMEVLENGQVYDIPEEPIDTKTGTRTLHTKKIPILDKNDKPAYLLGISEDITERKQAEMELQKTNDLLRAIIEAAPTAIAGLDLDGNVQLVWNPAAEKMLGWSAEEVMGRLLPSVPADSLEEFRGFRERIRSGKTLDGVEVRRARRDGTPIDYSIYASPLHDPDGRITGNVCVLVDVTERKRTEELLRQSEEKYRTLFEESIDGVHSVLRDGEITDANASFCGLFGYTKEEMIGKDIRELYVNPADRQRFLKEMEKRGFVKDFEVKLRKKDGKEVHCLLSSSVHLGKDGSIIGYRGILRDLTLRKALQRQLLQAQKMESIGTLAGGIAHDFNNLLQVILGYSDMLLFDKKPTDPDYEGLHAIRQAGRDGGELAKRILAFSRRLEPDTRPVNLNNEITRVQKMLERTIPKMIRIEILLADHLMTVNADPGQLEQVLLNLAVNARDAMPDGGRLTIETSNVTLDEDYSRTHLDVEPGEYVLLTLSDTGHGMDREVMGHIFEPFFTTKVPGEGTGLGLAMVFGIVKSHKGHIICYSEPGAGTTFKIYLPAVVGKIEHDVAATRHLPGFGTETILLVDDEKSIRKFGEQLLRKAGYTVLTATNGIEALEVYRSNQDRIALVLLDLMMPQMGGKHCLEELLKINPRVKVVIASGYSANGPMKDALASGAEGFVNKPFEVKDLLQVVRRTLDKSGPPESPVYGSGG
ncbi:MAG: PAS domain S-box protein [Pseudomonadota bacterium]